MTVDPSTSVSLLIRLQDGENPRAQEDWNRFVALYTPLLVMWMRRRRVQEADVADLVQSIFVKLHQALPKLQIDPSRRFRGYLFTTSVNAYRDFLSKQKKQPLSIQELENAVATAQSDSSLFEEEHRDFLLRAAFDAMKDLLSERDWEICHRSYVKEESLVDIAQALGLTMNQVYLARSRGIKKVKEQLQDLLD
ncbi:MAG: sigma-70 family RNA polymerase sigma factor [Planctomycetales bacterium]|nr:sigma-70 family RNA polymerase sigma factor [Planctomycetales bacterium]